MIDDRIEKVRRRAYEIWESEGRPHGRHEFHWQQAESEIPEDIEEIGASEQPFPTEPLPGLTPKDRSSG